MKVINILNLQSLPSIILTVFQLIDFENIDFLQQFICMLSLMLLTFYFLLKKLINQNKIHQKFFEFISELKKNKKIDFTKKFCVSHTP